MTARRLACLRSAGAWLARRACAKREVNRPGIVGGSFPCEVGVMTKATRTSRFSPEVRERVVRMVHEQQAQHGSEWGAMRSIAEKIGCSAETLPNWVRQSERDNGTRPGVTTDERQRLRELEREVFELRRANEILRKASAFFAQAELVRRPR
jgi:transposase